MFLYGIVCEMDVFVVNVLELEWFTACPDISLFIPVSFENSIYACEEDVMADVEFAIVVKEGLIYVGLDYISKRVSILMLLTA